ncbi:MAG: hybrid sensor histidine kinase/response regulator [Prolixibacteraceae bacterium]
MSHLKSEKLRILTVDDNHLNLMVMKGLFNFQEYDVHFAECGEAALNMARKYLPHLILLDVVMPDISGFEVCRTLKQDPAFNNTSVIFITAASEIDFIIQAFEAGGVDLISKPFRKEELLFRLKKHIESKRTPVQLLETTTILQEIRKVQNRLFSVFGNDLRNGVIDVKMIFEFMSKGIIDPTRDKQYKRTILDLLANLDKSFSALENLNDWAITESGKLKNEPENINLNEAVVSLVNLYQVGIQSKKIQLNIRINSDHVVFADPTMLKTIIRNIFSNAYKYTPAGGVISFESWIEPGFVKLAVSDTGLGMSPDIVTRILNPDVFFSTMGLNNEIGNGLGLKLCKDFIERSNGKIWIESAPNKGTTVFFMLPQKNEDSLTEDSRLLVW